MGKIAVRVMVRIRSGLIKVKGSTRGVAWARAGARLRARIMVRVRIGLIKVNA